MDPGRGGSLSADAAWQRYSTDNHRTNEVRPLKVMLDGEQSPPIICCKNRLEKLFKIIERVVDVTGLRCIYPVGWPRKSNYL